MAGFPAAHKKVIDSQSLLASVPAFFFDSTNYSHPVRCGGAQWREGGGMEGERERERKRGTEKEREKEGQRKIEVLVLTEHIQTMKVYRADHSGCFLETLGIRMCVYNCV